MEDILKTRHDLYELLRSLEQKRCALAVKNLYSEEQEHQLNMYTLEKLGNAIDALQTVIANIEALDLN